uniref:Uncharacterized protein n=1 Tax=Anguilla anguilla TaxID=7936 RepID=A0A0E9WEA7_ANGAN
MGDPLSRGFMVGCWVSVFCCIQSRGIQFRFFSVPLYPECLAYIHK